MLLTDDLEIHFLELPRLEYGAYSLEDKLVKWLLFIKGTGKERWEELASKEPALKKAMTTLEFISQDREARMLYEMRQRALHDERSMIEGARDEGRAEGRAMVARTMLLKGMAIPLIAELTGLTEEEIKQLRNQLH